MFLSIDHRELPEAGIKLWVDVYLDGVKINHRNVGQANEEEGWVDVRPVQNGQMLQYGRERLYGVVKIELPAHMQGVERRLYNQIRAREQSPSTGA